MTNTKGYTLIELMVAVGLFSIIMLLASGAYLMMINLNQQAQNISNGIDNLSFALETMTRNIRTGSAYSCGVFGNDCPSGGTTFTFKNQDGVNITYSLSGTSLQQVTNGPTGSSQSLLTDSSVNITSLIFYAYGTKGASQGDYVQATVTMIVSGTVSAGSGKPSQSFTVETGATMRGSDL